LAPADAHLMVFSKRIHLVLDVQEKAGTIRDSAGGAFDRY
jgi:hypothetical protein